MHLRDALASKNYETPFMASLLAQLRPWGPIWGKASSPEDMLSIESRKGYGALSLPHGPWTRRKRSAVCWPAGLQVCHRAPEHEMWAGNENWLCGQVVRWWGVGQRSRLPMGRDQSTTHSWRSRISISKPHYPRKLTPLVSWVQIQHPWCLFLLISHGPMKLLWP